VTVACSRCSTRTALQACSPFVDALTSCIYTARLL
jgi:hypothetical protein